MSRHRNRFGERLLDSQLQRHILIEDASTVEQPIRRMNTRVIVGSVAPATPPATIVNSA
jgi:hypothetical protein